MLKGHRCCSTQSMQPCSVLAPCNKWNIPYPWKRFWSRGSSAFVCSFLWSRMLFLAFDIVKRFRATSLPLNHNWTMSWQEHGLLKGGEKLESFATGTWSTMINPAMEWLWRRCISRDANWYMKKIELKSWYCEKDDNAAFIIDTHVEEGTLEAVTTCVFLEPHNGLYNPYSFGSKKAFQFSELRGVSTTWRPSPTYRISFGHMSLDRRKEMRKRQDQALDLEMYLSAEIQIFGEARMDLVHSKTRFWRVHAIANPAALCW